MRSPLNAKIALVGGVLAGIGASACCVGPLLLLSLGISGAWIGNLTSLEPYRPIFIVLTLIFVGLAFRKLYLVPQTCSQTCNSEAGCTADRTRKSQRLIFWIVVPLLVCLVASPWLIPIFYH
jgi:mercuric ion transport protein